jgi:capsular exopolysaccharide synthesis family protein
LIKRAGQIQEVSIVRPALKPTGPINPPSTLPTGVAGVIVGGILGLVFAFIMETLDTSLGTIEDVEELLGTAVLGLVPYIDPRILQASIESRGLVGPSAEVVERNARLVTHFDPKSGLAESYRTLRTNIQFLLLEKHIKTLILTSSMPGEGKTTTTANLAMTFAQAGMRVLLIDADMRRAMQHNLFGLDKEPGLSDVILGNYEWPETIRTVADIIVGSMGMEAIMLTPGMDNLHIMTAGTTPPNPSELLGSQRMTDFIAQVREAYDLVMFDTPPVLQVSDATILGSKVEGLVLVYQVGKIARGSLMRSKKQLDHVKANILGTILNGLRPEMGDYGDYGYGTYSSYYGSDDPTQDHTDRGRLPSGRASSSNGRAGEQEAATGHGWLSRMVLLASYLWSPFGLLFLGIVVCLGGLVWWRVLGGSIWRFARLINTS